MILSPNPATNHLRIQFPCPTRNARLRLYATTGPLLLERSLPDGSEQAELDLGTIPNGLYLFQLWENKAPVSTEKLLLLR
jgi:hypothetical protein